MYRIWEENDVWEKWINDQISKHEYIAIEWPKFIDSLDQIKNPIPKLQL